MSEGPQERDTKDPVIELFDTRFKAPSIGIEQELNGARIGLKQFRDRLIGVMAKDGTKLVAITTDMDRRDPVGEYQTYTLELITTPTEGSNVLGLIDRVEALELIVPEIVLASTSARPLVAKKLGQGYELTIRQPDHVILPEKNYEAGVSGSDRQGTLCVPAAWLLREFLPEATGPTAKLDDPPPVLQVSAAFPAPSWFDPGAIARAPAKWRDEVATRQVYAVLESAIREFVRVLRSFPAVKKQINDFSDQLAAAVLAQERLDDGDPDVAEVDVRLADAQAENAMARATLAVRQLVLSPAWKNKWTVLPRTRLDTLLNMLAAEQREAVKQAINAFTLGDLDMPINLELDADTPEVPDANVLFWAKRHILGGLSLGGHFFEAQTIADQPGFLVEYRGGHPAFFVDKFFYAEKESRIFTHTPADVWRKLAQAWLTTRT